MLLWVKLLSTYILGTSGIAAVVASSVIVVNVIRQLQPDGWACAEQAIYLYTRFWSFAENDPLSAYCRAQHKHVIALIINVRATIEAGYALFFRMLHLHGFNAPVTRPRFVEYLGGAHRNAPEKTTPGIEVNSIHELLAVGRIIVGGRRRLSPYSCRAGYCQHTDKREYVSQGTRRS